MIMVNMRMWRGRNWEMRRLTFKDLVLGWWELLTEVVTRSRKAEVVQDVTVRCRVT